MTSRLLPRWPGSHALVLFPLLLFLGTNSQAGPARALNARAAAAATLDVCQLGDGAHWRYAGVVAVGGEAAASLQTAYTVQWRPAGLRYVDLAAIDPLPTGAQASMAGVVAYRVEAPAAAEGALRGFARVRLGGAQTGGGTGIALEPSYEVRRAVCPCAAPEGCVGSYQAWRSKVRRAWPGAYRRGASFYASGRSWQQLLDDNRGRGNAYTLLARQSIAAWLNRAHGASVPAGVQATLDDAAAWFASGVGPQSCRHDACPVQQAWAAILAAYNEGNYPGAPGACPD